MFQDTRPTRAAETARRGFLARYTAGTRALYELDLRIFFGWCAAEYLDPLEVRRADLEEFIDHLMTDRGNSARSATRRFQTVRSFLRLAVADELIDRDPTFMVRMPRWHVDRTNISHTTPRQVQALLDAATTPAHGALIGLMAYLGLRVSEACNANIETLTESPLGYTVLTGVRKGGKQYEAPLPVPLLRLLLPAIGDRTEGPIILTRAGRRQTRNGAYDWVKRLCGKAGLPGDLHPHSLRHGCAKMLLAAGVPIDQIQKFMGHADIRTTMHYADTEPTLDQHAAHVTARILASVV